MEFQGRENFAKYIHLPQNPKLIEVGVFRGDFSDVLLKLQPSELYLIDPYKGIIFCADDNSEHSEECDGETLHTFIVKKYIEKSEVKVWRLNSNCLSIFSDKYFDFIYIDGDHSYEWVKHDLTEAKRIIKPGGWIAGHDYGFVVEVTKAVDEFLAKYNLTVTHWGISRNGKNRSFFIKNE